MAEWFVETGIGEERAIRLHDGAIAEARVRWPGALAFGLVEDAILVSRASGRTRGTARFASGEEALVDRLPRQASEGASIRLEVTRAAVAEKGRSKLARARPTDKPPGPAASLADELRGEGHRVLPVHRFAEGDWDDLVIEALAGEVSFGGGNLLLTPAPAMTLIDIDGALPSRTLALAAVPAIAATLLRHEIGGSIGIDFPTIESKAERREVDEALSAALAEWPHERTAMNGFGFVQLVARSRGPSLLQRAALDPAGLAARLLLRQAEAVNGAGPILLTCHPLVAARIESDWLGQLTRRAGRPASIKSDPGLALAGSFAQAVPL